MEFRKNTAMKSGQLNTSVIAEETNQEVQIKFGGPDPQSQGWLGAHPPKSNVELLP